jgi:hypothetical protein
MYLLALTGDEVDQATEETVNELVADLLARAYVIRACPTQAPGSLAVRVTPLEHGDPASPLVVPRTDLWLGPDLAAVARSVLVPLLRARLVTVLYLAPGADRAMVEALLPLGDQVVTDAAEGADLALWVASRSRQSLVDLTFLRGVRWRELVARFFDDPELVSAAWDIRRVEITQIPGVGGGAVESELLVAWLGSRLGWQPRGAGIVDRKGLAVSVELCAPASREAPAGSLQSLALIAAAAGGELRGSIVRDPRAERLAWSLTEPRRGTRGLRIPAALPSFVRLVSRALGQPDRDPAAGDALRWLGRWRSGK